MHVCTQILLLYIYRVIYDVFAETMKPPKTQIPKDKLDHSTAYKHTHSGVLDTTEEQ